MGIVRTRSLCTREEKKPETSKLGRPEATPPSDEDLAKGRRRTDWSITHFAGLERLALQFVLHATSAGDASMLDAFAAVDLEIRDTGSAPRFPTEWDKLGRWNHGNNSRDHIPEQTIQTASRPCHPYRARRRSSDRR